MRKQPVMFARRLIAASVAATALVSLAPLSSASAASKPLYDTIAPAWGKGAIKIVRTGWTVNVTGTLTDTRSDGDCVYVEAVLQVDDWADPDGRTPDHCSGNGTSTGINVSLTPGSGSKLASIRVRVCAADSFADSCLERIYTVPVEQAVQPQYKPNIDSYMSMSMASFKQARAAHPAPYNWTADGCSTSPDYPSGFNFKDACNRHDFGYRNYGKGSIKASPFDSTRAAVDSRLRTDLMNECARYSGSTRSDCEDLANTYYAGVRIAGGKAFYVS